MYLALHAALQPTLEQAIDVNMAYMQLQQLPHIHLKSFIFFIFLVSRLFLSASYPERLLPFGKRLLLRGHSAGGQILGGEG